MEELARVEVDLHKAQDMVAWLEPPARLVIDLRERQKAWDEEHAALVARGAVASGMTPFKSKAARALGPRPSLTL